MDAAKKAFLRTRMREAASKREKRIDSPLVRYNELDQPVCKVCNIAVKSESLWAAHLASRQHKEAVDKFKAQAKTITTATATKNNVDSDKNKSRVSSSLPDDFWDQPEKKRSALDDTAKQNEVLPGSTQKVTVSKSAKVVHSQISTAFESTKSLQRPEIQALEAKEKTSVQPLQDGEITAKGSLPEGFFDNVDADYRARGLEPPKYDVQNEWKEFQKAIQDDVQELDLRLEEEEFDAAEEREVLEGLEQRELLERLEKLRKREQSIKPEEAEIAEVIAKVAGRKPFSNINLMVDDETMSDEDSEEEDTLMDWRAKQF